MHLKRIHITPSNLTGYPYNLPLFQESTLLSIKSDVLILVGDNGSGKSTLLKMLEERMQLYQIEDPTNLVQRTIDTTTMTLDYYLSKPKGFFFESQKFINYIEYVNKEIESSQQEIKRIDLEYKNASEYARSMAKSPHSRTIHELKNMYSRDLSHSSHGESYLDFFASRIKENQIYLLDEPETPLSAQNQLTLLSMIMDARKKNNQFIIATHSPILSAIPNAQIIEICHQRFEETTYEEITSIKLLKQFLNHKDQFLQHFK